MAEFYVFNEQEKNDIKNLRGQLWSMLVDYGRKNKQVRENESLHYVIHDAVWDVLFGIYAISSPDVDSTFNNIENTINNCRTIKGYYEDLFKVINEAEEKARAQETAA